MERVPKAANGRNSPPEKAEYKPAAATAMRLHRAARRRTHNLAVILTSDSMTVRSIVPNFPYYADLILSFVSGLFCGRVGAGFGGM
jgi:hypothetical protein